LLVARGLPLAVTLARRPRPRGDGIRGNHPQHTPFLNAERLVERRLLIGQTLNAGRQLAAEVAGVLRFAQANGQDAQPGGLNFLVVQL
jgi:hypothetical protein